MKHWRLLHSISRPSYPSWLAALALPCCAHAGAVEISSTRTHLVLNSSCPKPNGPVITHSDAVRPLGRAGQMAMFHVVVAGEPVAKAIVSLCIEVWSRPVYAHAWPAKLWLENAESADSSQALSVIRAEVDSFFSRSWVFQTFEQPPNDNWTRDFDAPYAPVAYSLKQYEFRRARGMRIGMSLPGLDDGMGPPEALSASVRDSLVRAPADSAAVRALIAAMARAKALAFVYHVGGELWPRIAWDSSSGRFLLVR